MTPFCHRKVPEGQLAPTFIAFLKGGQGVHPFFLVLGSDMETKIGKEVESVTIIHFTLNL